MVKKEKNILYLGLVSFFTDISSEMIFPVLPIFLTTVLKANMAVVGLIEGVAESTSAILKLFSGMLSDKFKKNKLFVFVGYTLSALMKPLLAISNSWTHVMAIRFLDRVGKGIRTSPRDKLIASYTTRNNIGKYFGLHRTLDTLGAIFGTIITAVLLHFFMSDFKLIFLLSFIPGLISLFVLSMVKEQKCRKTRDASFKIEFRDLSPKLKKFFVVVVIFNLANFSYAFFLLRAKEFVTLALIPIIYLTYNLTYAGLSLPFGKLSDKVGKRRILSAAYILFGLMSLGFAFTANSVTIWVLFLVYGIFMALTDGISRAYVSELENKKRGTALGIYHGIVGITTLPANLIGGLLWNHIGVVAPFVYASVISLVSSLLLML